VKVNEKKLELRMELPQTFLRNMISDELRLSQVLINLLSNAVKFTPDYGVITLRVDEAPLSPDRSHLRIEVIDTGIGIKKEALNHVFESFEQADGSITRQFGGTGLGLAICKRIVHLMDGEITAESEFGKGACFRVEFDIDWGKPLPRATGDRSLRQGLRILVVDDAPDILEYFKSTLEQFEIQCDTAINGMEALELVNAQLKIRAPYDIIFLDWFMPEMNGGQTAVAIRELMGDSVMVVMISSTDWTEIEENAVASGVSHYLPKPVLPSDLYNKLVELTGAAEAAEASDEEMEAVYDWSGHCILLAEDIEINREIIAGILEDTGVVIDCAEDGRMAVALFTANPSRYKIILMDVQMPVLDGLNAARLIRASGVTGCKKIPIMAMTANAFKEDEQAALDAGMNGHIAKPVNVDTLMHVLKKVLV
jgi:CheY-like chemotaxis protein